MNYRYRAVEPFWKHFHRLNDAQKESARRTHKIHKLSSLYGEIIYAVDIEGDLRSAFCVDGNWIVSVDIGTHDIYKG